MAVAHGTHGLESLCGTCAIALARALPRAIGSASTMNIPAIFEAMPQRYKAGTAKSTRTYYFSVGDHKYTVRLSPETCTVESGKTVDDADVVLKTTPELFEKMVIKGKMPGPIDIARGKIKTNDPGALKQLRDYFDFSGL